MNCCQYKAKQKVRVLRLTRLFCFTSSIAFPLLSGNASSFDLAAAITKQPSATSSQALSGSTNAPVPVILTEYASDGLHVNFHGAPLNLV
ncbi:MAG TPA: hypothetical protein VFE51_15230 [Verrucomicrobiae bacterium]|nr:hypothetical protein [Verrucomicrobiae bacterium]